MFSWRACSPDAARRESMPPGVPSAGSTRYLSFCCVPVAHLVQGFLVALAFFFVLEANVVELGNAAAQEVEAAAGIGAGEDNQRLAGRAGLGGGGPGWCVVPGDFSPLRAARPPAGP